MSSGVRLELRAVRGLEDLVRCGLELLPAVTLELLPIGLELRADIFDLARGGSFFTGVAATRVIASAARGLED